jgi:hypothetical protein
MSNDRTPSGADEFLPILIYITIKASFSFYNVFILAQLFSLRFVAMNQKYYSLDLAV